MEHQEQERELMLMAIQQSCSMGMNSDIKNNHLLEYIELYAPKMYDTMQQLLQYPKQKRERENIEKLQQFKTEHPNNVMFN